MPAQEATAQRQWDVAISFLDRDRQAALDVSDGLGGRASVFVFPRYQDQTLGRDGVIPLSDIFGRLATLVVVLYRAEWGDTGWTQIERSSINSRRVTEKSEEFLMLVKMEDVETPPWLPAARIWGEWKSLGPTGLAGAIVLRLQELGKHPTPETALDVARRLATTRQWEQKRRDFLAADGREFARLGREAVFAEVRRLAAETGCQVESDATYLTVAREGITATLAARVSNSRDELVLQLWDCEFFDGKPFRHTPLEKHIFAFDLEQPDVKGWRDQSAFIPSLQLAEATVMLVLQRLDQELAAKRSKQTRRKH